MPFLQPYIPAAQGPFDAWAYNFATLIDGDPLLYGLVAGDAAVISNAYAAWHAAYLLATAPGTKTKVTVAAKDAERLLSMSVFRPYAVEVSLNPGVASNDKVALGVNPRTSVPSPIAAPASPPVLSVQSAVALTLYMRFRDPLTAPKVKAKPYGVTRVQVFGKCSATPIVDPALLPWMMDATKSPFVASFDASCAGQRFYYSGRWVVRTGLVSPYAAVESFIVP